MPAIGQLRADLLGELLEAAVAIGNTARADDGNLHGRSSEMAAFALAADTAANR